MLPDKLTKPTYLFQAVLCDYTFVKPIQKLSERQQKRKDAHNLTQQQDSGVSEESTTETFHWLTQTKSRPNS